MASEFKSLTRLRTCICNALNLSLERHLAQCVLMPRPKSNSSTSRIFVLRGLAEKNDSHLLWSGYNTLRTHGIMLRGISMVDVFSTGKNVSFPTNQGPDIPHSPNGICSEPDPLEGLLVLHIHRSFYTICRGNQFLFPKN